MAMSAKRANGSLLAFIYRLARKHVWKMHIDPTAVIARSAYIDPTWPRGVHIGAKTIIDEKAVILTHDLTRHVRLHTHIGNNCYIGPRVIVVPGVSIDDGAVVEAGSVATRNVEVNTKVRGNPARPAVDD